VVQLFELELLLLASYPPGHLLWFYATCIVLFSKAQDVWLATAKLLA